MLLKKLIDKLTGKTKTVTVFKSFRTDNIDPGEELNINTDNDEYSLSIGDAFQALINRIGTDAILKEGEGKELQDVFALWEVTTIFITLPKSVLDVNAEHDGSPLRLDISDVQFDMEAHSYKIYDNLEYTFDEATHRIIIDYCELTEIEDNDTNSNQCIAFSYSTDSKMLELEEIKE